jgi:hypothetical protein
MYRWFGLISVAASQIAVEQVGHRLPGVGLSPIRSKQAGGFMLHPVTPHRKLTLLQHRRDAVARHERRLGCPAGRRGPRLRLLIGGRQIVQGQNPRACRPRMSLTI